MPADEGGKASQSRVLGQGGFNLFGMLTQVQNPLHDYGIWIIHFVINGVWESFGQQAVISKNLLVNSGIQCQGVDVCKYGIKEILADSFCLVFIKLPT